MEICSGGQYTVVIRFPWGERREAVATRLTRDADGTVHWHGATEMGVEPYLDQVLRESEQWIFGWAGGSCDVTVVISHVGSEAPEP